MDEQIGLWWNGKWGRMARRRVRLHRTDEGYRVTAIEGDDDGHEDRVWVLPTEDQARQLVADLTETEPGDPLSSSWRELPLGAAEPHP